MLSPREGERTFVGQYLSRIRGRRIRNRDEEACLARRARAGDLRAMHRLIEGNLGFVVKVASEYRNMGLPFEDLLGEGNVGLLEAARRFNADRGTKFITFAVWWVRKSILAALSQQVSVVHIPENQRRKLRRIRDAESTLTATLRRIPERGEVAGMLSDSASGVEETLQHAARTRSLSEPAGHDGSHSLTDLVADRDSASGEELLLQTEARELILLALEELDPQERQVLEYRYGLSDGPTLVLREVGQRMGVSRERVRQIEVKATRRLRRILEPRLRGRLPSFHIPLERAV